MYALIYISVTYTTLQYTNMPTNETPRSLQQVNNQVSPHNTDCTVDSLCMFFLPLVMASYLAIQLVITVSLLRPSISGSVRIR